MAVWAAFAAGTAALTLLLLYLTRRSRRVLESVRVVDDPADASDASVLGDRRGARPAEGDDAGPPRTFDDPGAVDREFGADPPVANAAEPMLDDGDGDDDSDRDGDADRDHDGDADRDHDGDADRERDGDADRERDADGRDARGTRTASASVSTTAPETASATATATDPDEGPVVTTAMLLANAAASQGVALAALVALAWLTDVPASAFGVAAGDLGPSVLAAGVAVGVALYLGNEAAAALGERFGIAAPERLREAMAPTDAREWTFLLVGVLPVIAVFEEALFRGALVGAFAVGLGVDPWLLVVPSSVAFGLGHGAQGRAGIAVTTLLGLALAAVFVATGSLLVVVVAHYVVNALEFVVREGIGWEPPGVAGGRT